eukprot:3525315-Prymnesium_polylepis.1
MVLSVAHARACAVRTPTRAWSHVGLGGRDIRCTTAACGARATVAFTRTALSRSRDIASPMRLHRVLSDLTFVYHVCTGSLRE